VNKLMIATGDALLVAVAIAVATAYTQRYVVGDPTPLSGYLLAGAMTLPIWLLALGGRRLYEARFVSRRAEELRRVLEACMIATGTTIVAAFALRIALARTWVLMVAVLAVLMLVVYREVVRRVFQARHRRRIGLCRVVIVGDNDEALALESMLRSDESLGYEVVGRVVQRSAALRDERAETLLDDIFRAVDDSRAQGVVIAVTALDAQVANRVVRALAYTGLHLELSSALSDIAAGRLSLHPIGRVPVVYIEPVRRFGWTPIAKRGFDIVVSATLLVLLSPVLAAVAVAIALTAGGPVLFHQERVGRNGALFRIHKFRTMVTNAEDLLIDLRDRNEADGPLFKLRDDPRVTPFGRALRKSSLDELPQLWNVLRGEMSLVGPRPALPEECAEWSGELWDRIRVRPGITGMWQVSGRSDTSFGEYVRLDLYYVDNWSLVIDLSLLAKTIPAVLARRGAA
jgi:exopolysaccharide biosynthesis polyprenyl glycosylphosphotransferase